MIRILKIDPLLLTPSIDHISFHIDVIKKYMKDSQANTLYSFQNPHEKVFSIDNDSLVGLNEQEIYSMVNLEGTKTTTNQDDVIGQHFISVIEICQRMLLDNEAAQSVNKALLLQNEKIVVQNEKIVVQNHNAIEHHAKLIDQHEKLISALHETQKDLRGLFGMVQTNQKVLLKFIKEEKSDEKKT